MKKTTRNKNGQAVPLKDQQRQKYFVVQPCLFLVLLFTVCPFWFLHCPYISSFCPCLSLHWFWTCMAQLVNSLILFPWHDGMSWSDANRTAQKTSLHCTALNCTAIFPTVPFIHFGKDAALPTLPSFCNSASGDCWVRIFVQRLSADIICYLPLVVFEIFFSPRFK